MLDPKDFTEIGSWPNGEYFNGLFFEGEDPKYHKKATDIDYGLKDMLVVDDHIFYPLKNVEQYRDFVRKDPLPFLKWWNKLCIEYMQRLKDHASKHRDYEQSTDDELLKIKQEFEEEFKTFVVFLNPLIYIAEVFEEYIIKNVPDLDFNEIRPIDKVSAERLNEDLVDGKKSLEELEKEYGWYRLSLIRGKPLTITDLEEIKKTAKKSQPIKVSENELIRLLQKLIWLKFERIDAYNYSLYKMFNLYKEIFKRISLDMKYWDVFIPSELDKALISKQIPEDLDSRFENRGVIKEDNVVRHLNLKEIEEYRKLFLAVEDTDVIKGTVACKGVVQGIARVIKTQEDLKKIQEGDVLIATETLVQYEPYMHKTKAMAVEMGGMLCHTAIFAREFNIPAIVGVKKITSIIKDGEMVEIDADKGIVRKI